MNYNDMMRTVAGATGLTRRQADEAVITTLTVLAEVISADETRDLLAQLPKSVRERVPVSGTTLPMRPIEFLARVADLAANTSVEQAEGQVRAVFQVLTQAVNAGEMNDLAGELGDEFAELLDREDRIDRRDAARDLESNGVRDVLLSAAAFVLRTTIALARRPVEAGLGMVAAVRR